jgi:zinc protease
MNHKTSGRPRFHLICALFMLLALGWPAAGQTIPEPTREKLLNGLTILLWQRPGDPEVLLKLRVNGGAAFDFAGKGGSMALLGDALFPDPTTREFITEQLGGRLEIVTDHDAIEVTISGKTSDLERLIDLLHGALVSTQLTPENVARVREARLKTLSEKAAMASDVADREIAARLFAKFPYGHPAGGTLETVTKIDRADLMLARERFLNADNAAEVVIGGVEKSRVMRALRQLLGPWSKSDRTVPATFRPPDAPDARVQVVDHPGATAAEVRLAVRGLARADRDYAAASLLAQILRTRWQAISPDLTSVFVRHEAHLLPGIFVFGASAPTATASKALASAQQLMKALAQSPPTIEEVERARNEILSGLSSRTSQTDSVADLWLDIETFKLTSHESQSNVIRSITPADVQRVAGRLFKDASPATVVVGNSALLRSGFDRAIEVRGEAAVGPGSPAKKP